MSIGSYLNSSVKTSADKSKKNKRNAKLPLVVATWNVKFATSKAWEVLSNGGSALDAVEKGCRVEEANEKGQSVGCLLYTSPSPRDLSTSRMPSSA